MYIQMELPLLCQAHRWDRALWELLFWFKQVDKEVSGWISSSSPLASYPLLYPEPNQSNEVSPCLIHTNQTVASWTPFSTPRPLTTQPHISLAVIAGRLTIVRLFNLAFIFTFHLILLVQERF